MSNQAVFLKHESGATHALRGRKLAKLLAELKADRGGPEVCALQEAGYEETLGGLPMSEITYERLADEAAGKFASP